MVNLDTHVLIFAAADELRPEEYRLVATEELAISGIVLWELAMLVERGRVEVDLDSPEFRVLHARLNVIPITLEIAQVSTRLDFPSDPADAIIAATSIVEKIPLLTRDRSILKSRMVPFPR